MFKHTYTKFYVFILAALAVGFVTLEFSHGSAGNGFVTGMVVSESSLSGSGIDLASISIGFFLGALIIGTLVYVFHSEQRW